MGNDETTRDILDRVYERAARLRLRRRIIRGSAGLTSIAMLAAGIAYAARTSSRAPESFAGTGPSPANEQSQSAISDDGNVVAFVQENGRYSPQVLTYDFRNGVTKLVSANVYGRHGHGTSSEPSISANGNLVAFVSAASDLVPSDRNRTSDVFLRDMVHKKTSRLSVSTSRAEANGTGSTPPNDWEWTHPVAIAAGGSAVVFMSASSNLVTGDTNGTVDVFYRDIAHHTTERISLAPDGGQFSTGADSPSISADGGRVVFSVTVATVSNVYLYERAARVTRLLVPNAKHPAISSNGRFVAFDSAGEIKMTDLDSGTTTVVGPKDGAAGELSGPPALSGDGSLVGYYDSVGGLSKPVIRNADGSDPKIPMPNPEFCNHLGFSSDGHRIVIAGLAPRGSDPAFRPDVFWLNRTTGRSGRLVPASPDRA